MKFDDPEAGNSMKDRRLRNELKDCLPITAITKKFPFKKGHAITVHMSQGSTLNYIKGELSRSTCKKTATGKTYQQPISQGRFYTLLSHAKRRDKVLLLNFDPEQIKVNESALEEMVRMRQESFFMATSLEKCQWY